MVNTIEQAGGAEWIYSHVNACKCCTTGWDERESMRAEVNAEEICQDCHARIVEELREEDDYLDGAFAAMRDFYTSKHETAAMISAAGRE